VTKIVHWKEASPEHGSEASTLNPAWRVTAAHYINRYYEVREQDAPVKYVWNGQTRVARITGLLGSATRLQQLRLAQGWNHVCVTVAGQFPALDPAQNSDIGSCALFSETAPGNGLVPVIATTPIPAGATLWIYTHRAMTLMLKGTPAAPLFPNLTGTSQFIGNRFGESLDFRSILPSSAWLAHYDALSRRWQHQLPTAMALPTLNEPPKWIAPGQVIWTSGGTSGPLVNNVASLQVRFYHQDHLGSTTLVTDLSGALVEEIASYAFGQTRNDYRPAPVRREAYGFSQKERDAESGLDYFEARYLNTTVGRFATVDPLITIDMKGRGQLPQTFNVYSYSLNNPLKYIDPLGLEVTAKTTKDAKGNETTKITITGVIINESSTALTDTELKDVKSRITKQMTSSFTGSDGDNKWSISVDLKIVKDAKNIKSSDHVIRIVDVVDPLDAGTLGEVNDIGGKEVKIKPGLISKKPSDPGNASLERTAAHELGHTLGLRHDTDPDNPIRDKMQNSALMRQTKDTDGTSVNIHEIRRVQQLFDDKKLNQ
jgi:RHS repeat-associated protein